MKVYVVTYNQSYDGPIYENVFASEAAAEAWILKEAGSVYGRSLYEIIEEDIDDPSQG